MIGITTRLLDAEKTGLRTELLVAAPADGTSAAADPRVRHALITDLHPVRRRPDRHHFTHNLMAHGEGRHQAAILHGELLSAAQIVIALPEMKIAMAHTGRERAQENFGSLRLRRGFLGFFQRRAEIDDVITLHRMSPTGV